MKHAVVKPDGSLDAKFLLIGEAPGPEEMKAGAPFVGNSGWKLRTWWKPLGVERRDFFITNVLDTMPPGVDIEQAIERGHVTKPHIEAGKRRIIRLIETMPKLRVIIPCGNYATAAVSEFGKTAWSGKGAVGILEIRGSILFYTRVDGSKVKVIPTLHPAAVLRMAKWERRAILDWRRIVEEAESDEPLPTRYHKVQPTLEEIEEYRDAARNAEALSIDIETWGGSIKMVGFAANAGESLVVPTTERYWRSHKKLKQCWGLVKELCENGVDKIMQNGLFDAYWLRMEQGIATKQFVWDTMGMHHALYPNDNHGLAYLASIYTRQPYWKDDAKEAEGTIKHARTALDGLYIYNGLDVTVTYEVFERLYDELESKGMMEFYLRHYADMYEPLFRVMIHGVRVDSGQMCAEYRRLQEKAIATRDRLTDLAGHPLYTLKTIIEKAVMALYGRRRQEGLPVAEDDIVAALSSERAPAEKVREKYRVMQAKGVSDQQFVTLLHKEWHAPKVGKGTKTGKAKCDAVTLLRIKQEAQKLIETRKRYKPEEMEGWKKTVEAIPLALESNRAKHLSTFFDESKADSDGRIRCQYKYLTLTGRLSSTANPIGTGRNNQNGDRESRGIYVPDRPDWIMVEIDLSQAEARVVGALTGDEEMIRVARSLPTEMDVHRLNATMIFSHFYQREVKPEEITKEQRYLGKRGVHAASYGLHARKLSDILMKDGYYYSEGECAALIKAYMTWRTAIPAWQRATRRVVIEEQRLCTSWGRQVDWTHWRLDDELYRKCYAYVPQSEIGDLLNQWGYKRVIKLIEAEKMESRVNLQVHDSLVLSCPLDEVYDIMAFLKKNLEGPRKYGQIFGREVELSVPCEYGIGRSWAKAVEWKALPGRSEIESAAHELLKG